MTGGRERRQELDYIFVPVPRDAVAALASVSLSRDELAVLAVLYDRADRSTRRVRPTTLEQLAAAIGWTRTPDRLSKIVRGLKAKGWLDYPPVAGAGARYRFTLDPEPRPSEFGPSSRARPGPSSRAPRSGAVAAIAPSPASAASDFDRASVRGTGPTSASPGPSSRERPIPHSKPGSASRQRLAGPSSSERSETTVLTEERLLVEPLGSSERDQVVGEGPGDGATDSLLEALARVESERSEPMLDAIERARRAAERASVTRRDDLPARLEQLRRIAARPPAGGDAFLAEVAELVAEGVLLETGSITGDGRSAP